MILEIIIAVSSGIFFYAFAYTQGWKRGSATYRQRWLEAKDTLEKDVLGLEEETPTPLKGPARVDVVPSKCGTEMCVIVTDDRCSKPLMVGHLPPHAHEYEQRVKEHITQATRLANLANEAYNMQQRK